MCIPDAGEKTMFSRLTVRIAALACFGLAIAVYHSGFTRADDKKEARKTDEKKAEPPKPAFDPKDVRVGPPPELADLRKAVEEAARKGENVDEIRKQLDSLEKALAGKAWVKPKPAVAPPAPPAFQPGFPQPVFPQAAFPPFPGFDPRMQEAMKKAQELMLKAALLRGDDPAKAEELLKEARELMGALPGGLMLPPAFGIRPVQPRGTGSRLGVRVEKVPAALAEKIPAGEGILVAEVLPGTPAEKAGLKANDVILEFAGKPVSDDPTEFVRTVFSMKAGEKVDIVYMRKGKKGEAKAVPLADVAKGRRGGADLLPFPGFGPVAPFPVPQIIEAPEAPALPRLARPGVQRSSSTSVQVQDGRFTINADVDGVKFLMEGAVGDTNTAVPTKIEITDGKKKVEAESVEKVPAEYRDRVQRILGNVKIKK
jgi:hypothetical protein